MGLRIRIYGATICVIVIASVLCVRADAQPAQPGNRNEAKPVMKSVPVDLKPSRITLDLQDATAAAIFDEIERQSLNAIAVDDSVPDAAGFPQQVFTVKITDEPFWPAMARACRLTQCELLGLTPYDGFQGTNRKPGPILVKPQRVDRAEDWRGQPAFVSERGVVLAQSIARSSRVSFSDEQPAARGVCTIGMSALVEPTFFAVPTLPPVVTEAIDETGASLSQVTGPAPAAPSDRRFGMGATIPQWYNWSCPISISQPALGKRIKSLKGYIRFTAAKTRAEFEVNDVLSVGGWEANTEFFSVRFSPLTGGGDTWSTSISLKRNQADEELWKVIRTQFQASILNLEVLDEAGERLFMGLSGYGEDSRTVNFSRKPQGSTRLTRNAKGVGRPTKLKWTFVESTVHFQLPFEFKDLQTPK